ncbi:hypothetical protein HMPREF0765_2292 [Sphingobacterium spiritivorum ATCC 33300]|uniref:Uncharacterized protein n=1 Tax=Sphingobacterium spiritivorum ATCC 33300 TaxID=525372 RepID=C2FY86_SPHSI|nr:hypothetical protein [Sphingobacterium spiritivorum]EEI92139.1 hypothetical protein HMPREF0765_2292 [Sphingobacterium spiritivorum ATCC 33300]QQS96604.1 hypothetical protein I6J03_02525 [Sphingobacterium spiritivorum]
MKEDKIFLEIARQYFNDKVLYEDTIEYQRLLEKVAEGRENVTLQKKLSELISSIISSSEFIIEDVTRFGGLDRSYVYRIENLSLSTKERICDTIICVSFLAPYYCIYQRETIIYYDKNGERGHQSYNLNLDEFSFVSSDSLIEIRKLLDNMEYTEVKGDQIIMPLPYFYTVGIPHEEFTLFTALFKNLMEV